MVASDTPPQLDREAFLNAVRLSGVLLGPQLDRLARDLPANASTAREAARWLVDAGLLTSFQADRLLSGKEQGFVLGQYVILDQIGKSPAGKVYKARHRTMNRFASIKVLASKLTRSVNGRESFRAEARQAAQITHPNVVAILDVNEVADRVYLIREFVDGPTVDQMIRHGGPLSISRACEFARQASLGLAHAHEKNLAHGSMNPANLLVAPGMGNGKPVVKVTNFGLGRLAGLSAGDPSQSAPKCDPADFMAPEQYSRPGTSTPAADVYSLGCTLFYLLAGRPPFPGGTAADKAKRHMYTTPPPVEHFRPDVPPAVAGLVKAALAKDPEERWLTAPVLAMRLEAFADSEDTSGQVDFNLPATAAGSFVHSGPMTGLSGFYAQPGSSGSYPQMQQQPQMFYVPAPAATAMPTAPAAAWVGLADQAQIPTVDANLASTPLSTINPPRPQPRRPQGSFVGTLIGLLVTAAMLGGTAYAGFWILKHFGK
jgi:serine/threonine protein kinase